MIAQHPFVLLFDQYRRKAQFSIAKIWASLTVAPFFKIEYERLENLPPPDVPAVYVSNHQSFLDIYTLLTLGRSFKFISKTGIFLFPIIGWAMLMLGVIPLKRMDSRSQMVAVSFLCCYYYLCCCVLSGLGDNLQSSYFLSFVLGELVLSLLNIDLKF